MSTLHVLRRRANLSLGALAQTTGIPLRRLAQYEYGDLPLAEPDRSAIAFYFGVEPWVLSGGWRTAVPASSSLVPRRWQWPVAIGATAALVASVQIGITTLRQGVLASAPQQAAVPALPTETHVVQPVLEAEAAAPLVHATFQPHVADPTKPAAEAGEPQRCPLEAAGGTVVVRHRTTSGVGVVDLAVDSDGNGYAEPGATRGKLVVAAHGGRAEVQLNTWPAGNLVIIQSRDGWRTHYAHLASVSVTDGQMVQAGQQLGVVGQTGQTGGPQLAFQVWQHDTNHDPGQFVACAATGADEQVEPTLERQLQ